jgi:hypothetical protein
MQGQRQAFSQCTQIAAGRACRARSIASGHAAAPPAQIHCGSVIGIDSPTVSRIYHQCSSVHIKPHSRINLSACRIMAVVRMVSPRVRSLCPVPSSSTDRPLRLSLILFGRALQLRLQPQLHSSPAKCVQIEQFFYMSRTCSTEALPNGCKWSIFFA